MTASATGLTIVDYADSFSVGVFGRRYSVKDDDLNIEYALPYTGIENLTIKAIFRRQWYCTGPFDGMFLTCMLPIWEIALIAAEIISALKQQCC